MPKPPLAYQTLIHLRGRKTINVSRNECGQFGLKDIGALQGEGWLEDSFFSFLERMLHVFLSRNSSPCSQKSRTLLVDLMAINNVS